MRTSIKTRVQASAAFSIRDTFAREVLFFEVVCCVEERRGKNQTIKVEAASATPLVHSGFHFVCSAQNSKHSSKLKIGKVELFKKFCCQLLAIWRDQETLDTVVDIALPSSMSGRPGSTNNRGWERPRERERVRQWTQCGLRETGVRRPLARRTGRVESRGLGRTHSFHPDHVLLRGARAPSLRSNQLIAADSPLSRASCSRSSPLSCSSDGETIPVCEKNPRMRS